MIVISRRYSSENFGPMGFLKTGGYKEIEAIEWILGYPLFWMYSSKKITAMKALRYLDSSQRKLQISEVVRQQRHCH